VRRLDDLMDSDEVEKALMPHNPYKPFAIVCEEIFRQAREVQTIFIPLVGGLYFPAFTETSLSVRFEESFFANITFKRSIDRYIHWL